MKNRNAKLLLAKPGQRIRITNRQVVRYAPNCIAGYPTEYYGMQKDRSAAQNRRRNHSVKLLKINWLDNCPKCGHEIAAVESRGDEKKLYAGENVICQKCWHHGEIDADEGGAFVCWDELDNSQEGLKVWE